MAQDDPKFAVLNADVVNSSNFNSKEVRKWLDDLFRLIENSAQLAWLVKDSVYQENARFDRYRGDSFQFVLGDYGQSFDAAIILRTWLKSRHKDADLRIAIGIGTVDDIMDRPGTSDGEAFRISGRLMDSMKASPQNIAFDFDGASAQINAEMALVETIMDKWTIAQSETIFWLRSGYSIGQIARNFQVSQSAVSQRLASADWWAFEKYTKLFPFTLKGFVEKSWEHFSRYS